MSGGRLKVDYLVGGAVVKSFEVTDAVSKGVLDAGHTVPVYWYGKWKVASLFGSGPINGMDAYQSAVLDLSGGGLALYQELLQKLGLNSSASSRFRCRPSRLAGSRNRSPTPRTGKA